MAGTVVEVRVFTRHGVDKDERALAIERDEIERLAKDRDDELRILERSFYARLNDALMARSRHGARRLQARARPDRGCPRGHSTRVSGARSV